MISVAVTQSTIAIGTQPGKMDSGRQRARLCPSSDLVNKNRQWLYLAPRPEFANL